MRPLPFRAFAHLALSDDNLGVLGPLKSDIVEVDSSQVGTPLLTAYHPAPARMR